MIFYVLQPINNTSDSWWIEVDTIQSYMDGCCVESLYTDVTKQSFHSV